MLISERLSLNFWQAIAHSYAQGDYRMAIVDALHHLTHRLQDLVGLDMEGVVLVDEILGGETPLIKLTPGRTLVERQIQQGYHEMLRGIYLAIRLPRRNPLWQDDQLSADAILLFIDYLLTQIEAAEAPFRIERFLPRIFEPLFVENDRYAALLVAEIPDPHLLEALLGIYRFKMRAEGRNLGFVVRHILDKLPEEHIAVFMEAVSADLKVTNSVEAIITTLQLLRPAMWEQVEEAARLRIESKLIQSMIQGEVYLFGTEVNEAGALGTWANVYLPYFLLKDAAAWALIKKLEDRDTDDQRYVVRYFMSVLPEVMESEYQMERCVAAMSEAVRNNNNLVQITLLGRFPELPAPWQNAFRKALADFTTNDGKPFLPDPEEATPRN